MPVAAQRASMPVAFSVGVDFSAVMVFALEKSSLWKVSALENA
jgi:hypothetical protein